MTVYIWDGDTILADLNCVVELNNSERRKLFNSIKKKLNFKTGMFKRSGK